MCIFTTRDPESAVKVENTCIFSRFGEANTQFLAYEMSVSLRQETAMVLPLPTGTIDQNAVRFINLEDYPKLFDDLTRALQIWDERHPDEPPPSLSAGASPRAPNLPVHEVGAYEASFAPTFQDMDRLDPRFQLPSELWSQMPKYGDWGFVVFKLRQNSGAKRVHPMAFEFITRKRDALFFPTVHVHAGKWETVVRFDHSLYFQGDDLELPRRTWFRDGEPLRDSEASYQNEKFLGELRKQWLGGGQLSSGHLGRIKPASWGVSGGGQPVVQVMNSNELVRPDASIWALGLSGLLLNRDTWIRRGKDGTEKPPITKAQATYQSRRDKDLSKGLEDLEII